MSDFERRSEHVLKHPLNSFGGDGSCCLLLLACCRLMFLMDFDQLPITVFHEAASRIAISIVIFSSDNQKDRARELEREREQ